MGKRASKGFGYSQPTPPESLAPYVRTHPAVVTALLKLGQVTSADLIYDLGCGDGRVVIQAATTCGARGLGVDIDPERIREARQAAEEAQVSPLVHFRCQDLMTLDLGPATVVFLYLLPSTNMKLRQKLQTELRQGTRILTHSFDFEDWQPTAVTTVSDVINTYSLYLWRI
ncbi:MAG: methyltransferase domain-containing protein [Synechococcaceae cyanobacterium SM2_3_1]|nr:methyltransferase domain-containing protein [Synechococcaceae cyanobacterium SM2_3_1]